MIEIVDGNFVFKNFTYKFRGGTAAAWTEKNPVLGVSEPGHEIDTNKLKLGDGVTSWNSLPYLDDSFIEIVNAMIEEALEDFEPPTGSITVGVGLVPPNELTAGPFYIQRDGV